MILTQLGIGPSEGYSISDEDATWNEFLDSNMQLEAVKSYIYMKVRLLFDPPTSSAHTDALKQSINEYEWRLNVLAETSATSNKSVDQVKFKDRSTGITYDLYVKNSKLTLEEGR